MFINDYIMNRDLTSFQLEKLKVNFDILFPLILEEATEEERRDTIDILYNQLHKKYENELFIELSLLYLDMLEEYKNDDIEMIPTLAKEIFNYNNKVMRVAYTTDGNTNNYKDVLQHLSEMIKNLEYK